MQQGIQEAFCEDCQFMTKGENGYHRCKADYSIVRDFLSIRKKYGYCHELNKRNDCPVHKTSIIKKLIAKLKKGVRSWK